MVSRICVATSCLLIGAAGCVSAIDPKGRPADLLGLSEDLSYTEKNGLVVPADCEIYVRADGGSAGAKSEFGTGSSSKDFKPVLKGLPSDAGDAKEVKLGTFAKGVSVPLAMRTVWAGRTHFAFIGKRDKASRTAFFDVDKKPAHGERKPKPVFEKVEKDTWVLRLDDAASHTVNDNEGDVIIRIRVVRKVAPLPR